MFIISKTDCKSTTYFLFDQIIWIVLSAKDNFPKNKKKLLQ